MDHLTLTNPAGSSINVGSFRTEDDADYGSKDLLKAGFSENALTDGGLLALETVGVRHMVFPIRLASVGAYGGLAGVQGLIRGMARPGATLDVQLENVPTADGVRFDVVAGRLEERWRLPLGRISRLEADLKLDVRPFGYLPTTIVLASAASVGLPGALAIPNGSLLGDAPGLIEFYADATAATFYPAGSWTFDLLAWSLGGGSGGSPFWSGASLTGIAAASVAGVAQAPASQALHTFHPGITGWARAAYLNVGSAISARYTGRHRVFAYAKLTPSQALPFYVSLDAGYIDGVSLNALASSAPVATLPPAEASGAPGAYGAQASPAFALLDLGEVTLPAAGPGLAHADYLRLWVSPASSGGNVATPIVSFGGLFLLALDGPNGVMPRGIGYPSIGNVASSARLALDGIGGNALVKGFGGTHEIGRAHV